MANLREGPLKTCINVIKVRIGYEPISTNVRSIIEEDEDLVKDLNRWYPNEVESMDTADRHALLDRIGLHFCNHGWPINADSVDDKVDFFNRLEEKIKETGWKHIV